jgi:uncharacterized membrane protein YdjX (TVP38/TMEM64 family)
MRLSFRLKPKWVPICFLGGLLVFAFYSYHSLLWIQAVKLCGLFQDCHQLKKVIKSFGPYSPLIFISLHILHAVIPPIPGEAIEFLGGYLFGVFTGMFYSMIGLIMGSWLSFSIARIFEKGVVERFVSPELRKKLAYLSGHEGVIFSFLLFLIPGFPKVALCYILGLTPMHLGTFLIISTIGRIPGTLIATLQGAKVYEHQYKTFLILLVISALAALVFYVYHEEIHGWIKKLKVSGSERSKAH